MTKKAKAKLRGQIGETIAETLIAVLISALAMMMLAGSISTATRLILRSKEKMQQYYQNNAVVEKKEPGLNSPSFFAGLEAGADPDHKWAIKLGKSFGLLSKVYYYSNTALLDTPVVSYAVDKAPAP